MGIWSSSILEDDLALDIKSLFEAEVDAGGEPGDVARRLMETDLAKEILEEFDEDERDDAFYEESGSLFFAVAALQLDHDVLSKEVKRQTVHAIDAWQEIAAGDEERLAALEDLRSRILDG